MSTGLSLRFTTKIAHFSSPTGFKKPVQKLELIYSSLTVNHPSQIRFRHSGHLLLPAHLQNFPVTIRMHFLRKRGAKSRSILGKKPTRLEPDTTSVAQRFWPQRSGSPLWGLLNLTMRTPTAGNGTAFSLCFPLLLLGRRFFHAGKPLGVVNRVREHKRR